MAYQPEDDILPEDEIVEELERLDEEIEGVDQFCELYPNSKDRDYLLKSRKEWIEQKKVLKKMLDDNY